MKSNGTWNARAAGQPKTLVVAEHDKSMVGLYEALSGLVGYQVVGIASEARLALELISKCQPTCLIADFNLKGASDGLDLILQAKKARPGIYTLLVTAWNFEHLAQKIAAVKPCAVLQKPFMARNFLDALRLIEERAFSDPAVFQ